MTDNVGKAVAYFQSQFAYWSSHGGVETYLRARDRKSLAAEFAKDHTFTAVCEAFKEIGELQLRSQIAKMAEGLVGSYFNFPLVGEMDIIVGAIADACGFDTIGDKLIKIGAVAIVTAAFIGFLTAALGSSN